VSGGERVTRRFSGAALLAAVLLLAVGCGTTVSPAGSGDLPDASSGLGLPEPGAVVSAVPGVRGGEGATGAVAPTDAAPGASFGPPRPAPSVSSAARSSSPFTIGVTYINNDATSSALGVEDPNTITKKSLVRALVAGINAAGGIHGRRLVPVEYEWNSQSNNWSGDATAACARFTQDNRVSVVIDNAFGTIGGFRSCLERAGVFVVQSGPEGDSVASRAARLHANSNGMTLDRSYSAVLRGLFATGYLGKDNRLGVMIEGCPENDRAWTRVLKPLIARLGLPPAEEATVDCTTGFASAGPAASAVNNAILRFRGAGVDRVMFVSDHESVLLLLWGNAADSQGYRPGYLLSSAAQARTMRPQLPTEQQKLFHGVGSLPFGDTDRATLSAADTRCVQIVRRAGVGPATYGDKATLLFECGPFLLLDAALTAADGDGSAAALSTAVASLGTAFRAPGVLLQATHYTTTRHDGPALAQVFGFTPSCSCLRYSSTAFAP